MKKFALLVMSVVLTFSLVACTFESKAERTDREAELIQTGYDDGYADGLDNGYSSGYSAGYADGHREAQKHSEKYDELMRQAYQTTGGAGAAFKRDDSGNVMVEETAPNGSKVWVYFDP